MTWQQLLDIRAEAREEYAVEQITAPVACPNDGEPLQSTPDGAGLYCPFDGYRWPE